VGHLQFKVDSVAAAVGLDREGAYVVERVIRRVFCAQVRNTKLSEGEYKLTMMTSY
jgi:hypothetical protein